MKSSKFTILIVLALLTVSSLACVTIGWGVTPGSGRVIQKEIILSGFTGVELATFGDLTIEVGDAQVLQIEAEDNLIDYFTTEVDTGMLRIGSQSGISMRPKRPVKFHLTVRQLDTIKISGSGDITAPDLEAERFFINISGSGDMKMDHMATEALEIRLSGSGNLDIGESEAKEQKIIVLGSGDVEIGNLKADTLEAKIGGSGHLDVLKGDIREQQVALNASGDYDARNVESSAAVVSISGSGSMTIHVNERLEARITGSGDIKYFGNPTIKQSTPGSGVVTRIGG